MGIIRFAIENPVKITVAVILVVLFGLLSLFEIPVQLTPDVDRPIITVETYWQGASPQEIESEIIDRQEEKLKSVANLKKMTSSSREGQATINLEFPVYIDRDIAYRDVSDKLRQVTGYPEEVDEPVIIASDASDMSTIIAWLILSAEDGRDIAHLKTFVEDQIKPQLERAEGIAEVPVYGGRDREIQIEVDAHLLAARELTFRDVEQALRRQNKNISAGTIAQGKRDYTYRTIGEYRRIADIEETVIAHREGGPIRVRDVATVHDGLKKQYGFVRSKGKNVLAMPAKRETGANVIQTMRELNERIAAVNHDLLEPQGLGLTLVQIYDETNYIWSSIGLVVQNLFIGGLLAIVVLLLFLKDGSATGIVAVAIPISMIGTFLVITLLGRTLNVILLAGMAFAVGMVVDNAIVVLENIYRHRAMGKSRREAALDGAREVWGAVLASTLTTMAVFLPVITIREEAGQLFKDIAVAIAAGVGLSLMVSVLVIPPMASRFFHAARAHSSGGDKPWRFAIWVSSLVAMINRRISTRLAVVVGLSSLAIGGSWLLTPAAEYLPLGNKNLIFGFIFSPPGYSVEEFQRMAQLVEEGDPDDPYDGLRYAWEAELDSPEALNLPPVDIAVGKGGETVRTVVPPPIHNFFFVGYGGAAFMGAVSKEETNVKPLEYVLRRAGRRIPGVFNDARQASLFSSGGHRGAATIDIEIRGDDMDAVAASASALVGKLMEEGYGYPAPDPANFALGRPEVRFVPDRTKAADLGLDVRDLGFVLEACVDGAFVGEFNDYGDKIDMVIAVTGTDGATVEGLAQTPIYTPTGHIVPLNSIVDVRRTTAPQQINHSEQMNSIILSVTPQTGVPLQETMYGLEEEIITPLRAEGMIPPTVFIVLAGTADRLTQTQHSLIGNFESVVQRPRIAGLSVSLSVGLILLVVIAVAAAILPILGKRWALIVGLLGIGLVVFGFLALNPSLVLAAAQSRAILALVITYLLMAALFESFAYPFVIMFSVPLAAVGGFAALRVVHEISLYDVTSPIQQLDVLTMLGFVILVGIVVNNAILIVHQALNFQREEGLPPDEAVVRSVQTRTRPIFMSATTSIFGMMPLVVMPGAGSELYRGLGSVVVGGLLVSTVFTLVVVPAMFTLFLDFQRWLAATLQTRASGTPTRP